MKQKNSRCLVLNGDYSPLGIIDWKKAMIWSAKYSYESKRTIEILDFYKDDYINCVNKKVPIPAVIRTVRYFKLQHHLVNFSRKNLFIRDNYTCQYCAQKGPIESLTYDHVIPKSIWDYRSGSPTCWTNIVTSCVRCNRKKGNKTPKQANMPLIALPTIPNKSLKYLPVVGMLLRIREDVPEEWKLYLPDSYYNA